MQITAGDVQYGPLLFDQDAPCNAIAFRDNFAYLATSKVDGEAGLVRVDLSTTVLV
jgi:hypothetical protein